MLGYNEGHLLEFFKCSLHTRYYFLLEYKILEAVESAKHVVTEEKLEKQIAGQSSTPYMSLKTYPSEKHESVRFYEHKLLDNQIDRLAKVMDSVKVHFMCGPSVRIWDGLCYLC